MTQVKCIYGANPENLTENINEFLKELNIMESTSVRIHFTEVYFEGKVKFYAYLTY